MTKNKYRSAFVAVVLGAVLLGGSASAHSDKKEAAVLESYLKIQEALASDSLSGVSVAAKAIEKNAANSEIKNAAKKLASDKTLDSARKHFKALSAPMERWAKEEKPEGVDRVTCSMAKASWLQKRGAVKNPYYGREMSGCGEIQKD